MSSPVSSASPRPKTNPSCYTRRMSNPLPGLRQGARPYAGGTVRAAYFDVDNTLVDNESPDLPSPAFIAAARSASFPVALATARPLTQVAHILDVIKSRGISVLSNGAQLYDHRTRQVVAEWLLPLTACVTAADRLQAAGFDYWIAESDVDYVWGDGVYMSRPDKWHPEAPAPRPDYRPLRPTLIVVHFVDPDQLAAVVDLVDSAGDPTVTAMVAHQFPDGRLDVLIAHHLANKVQALGRALELEGVNLAETAFVGDGHNDTALIAEAGLGIAMANGVPEARSAAHFIAPSRSDDGAAVALQAVLGHTA
jgi:HAD superfamily hydrolase (TIGR01484 family)